MVKVPSAPVTGKKGSGAARGNFVRRHQVPGSAWSALERVPGAVLAGGVGDVDRAGLVLARAREIQLGVQQLPHRPLSYSASGGGHGDDQEGPAAVSVNARPTGIGRCVGGLILRRRARPGCHEERWPIGSGPVAPSTTLTVAPVTCGCTVAPATLVLFRSPPAS